MVTTQVSVRFSSLVEDWRAGVLGEAGCVGREGYSGLQRLRVHVGDGEVVLVSGRADVQHHKETEGAGGGCEWEPLGGDGEVILVSGCADASVMAREPKGLWQVHVRAERGVNG